MRVLMKIREVISTGEINCRNEYAPRWQERKEPRPCPLAMPGPMLEEAFSKGCVKLTRIAAN